MKCFGGRTSLVSGVVRGRPYSHAAFLQVLQGELDAAKAAGTLKVERVITTAQDSSIGVQGQSAPSLNFCANNYLYAALRRSRRHLTLPFPLPSGLSNHPALVDAASVRRKGGETWRV